MSRELRTWRDMALPLIFGATGLLSGWIGEGRWNGLAWAFITLASGMALGSYIDRKAE